MILKPPPGAGGGSARGPDADARSAATSGADGHGRGGRGGEGAASVRYGRRIKAGATRPRSAAQQARGQRGGRQARSGAISFL